jgi:hypothetical protein
MRTSTGLKWLLDDHLGSTAITADGTTGAKRKNENYDSYPTTSSARGFLTGVEKLGLSSTSKIVLNLVWGLIAKEAASTGASPDF